MSGLFTGLTNAANALNAAQYGLNLTGQNIANINTDGYARRLLNLVEVPPPDGRTGGSVDIGSVQAARDVLIEGRLRSSLSAEQQHSAMANSLSVVETALGTTGSSIDGNLSAFFNAFGALASDPTSATLRSGVLAQGQQLAAAFGSMSAQFDSAANAADAQIRGGVDQINTLAAQLVKLNAALGSSNGVDTESLKDQQAVVLKSLAGLVDISVMPRTDGGADVTVGNGRALVVGDSQYAMGVTSTPPSGYAAVTIGSGQTDITGEISGGTVGGLLHVRDTLVPAYKAQLDQLAYSVVQQVNTVHQAGYDLNGHAGVAFFTPLGAVSGAAAAMAVNPTVAADGTLVAASGTGTAGDNTAAKTIAALQNARVVNGSATFVDSWSQLVYQVGSDAQTAKSNQTNAQTVVTAVQQIRDGLSGVSLDQEATNMIMYQKAYQANAKYFATVNSALNTLMGMLGVTY